MNRNLFLSILAVGKSTVKLPADIVVDEGDCLQDKTWLLYPLKSTMCAHMKKGMEVELLSEVSFIRELISFTRTESS
jgi:hypothetical protein